MRIKKALTEKTQTNEIKKILLIDKNKASPLSTALQQEGYHLIHCDSVQKAWDLIYPHRPHLIVLHLYDFNNGAGLSDLQECQALAEGSWDNVWESPYHKSEHDNPLGVYPIENEFPVPFNYNEYSVQNAIGLNDDANGDRACDLIYQGICTIIHNGDNHMGYMGYRSIINPHPVYNSGAIGFVADDWKNENN